MTNVREIAGAITAPAGYRAAGIACGIKASGKPDLALVVSNTPASAAGVFTTNLAQAAPVLVARDHIRRTGGQARAIVVNSGCANACTGEEGLAHAATMARQTAAVVRCQPEEVLVASTGVIGVKLDMSKVCRGISEAANALSGGGGSNAAVAIMTTDPFPKETAAEVSLRNGRIRIGGIAKGSGMIEPMMATMLGFITTDAAIQPPMLHRALKAAVDSTFNAISVDGECSTNDCVLALANGASGTRITDAEYDSFVEALRGVCETLAVGIVRGGEGATKLITVNVTGAKNDADARMAARAIANSPLVKTAVHGGDPNWGRLIAVAGRSGAAFMLDRATVRIGPVELFHEGVPHDERSDEAAAYLRHRDISIEVNLGADGDGRFRMWTCDLSAEYVRINAEYRT